MTYHIDIQHACEDISPVTDEILSQWASLPLQSRLDSAELTLRIVNPDEITQLNHIYRKKNQPTNVLAFPAEYPDDVVLDYPLLGDVIICPAVLAKESIDQQKPLIAHWAHIIIHGVLHLQGYDHIEENDAMIMQAIETKLLLQLGFNNPYEVN